MSSPSNIKLSKLSAYLIFQRIIILTHEVIYLSSDARSFDKWELHQADSFIFLPQSSFICIGSFTIFIPTRTVHLDRVYDKAKFCTGGLGKPILIYHMIDRLSRISKFNDKQKVKDNI